MGTGAYESELETMGVDPTSLAVDERGTVVSRTLDAPETVADLPTMVVVREPQTTDETTDLKLEKTIGVGGTATVWAANQPSLKRRVAVKELRSDRRSAAARSQLLREAWVTGGLEHPNIVPVHALGLTAENQPILVMKFIEGTPWRQSLTPLYATEVAPAPEDIDRELRTFTQVCNAVHFAHSRDVVHRDLKPDNVMIGPFEEVYVVDWGLALRLDKKTEGITGIAGTPGYMAPEMAVARVETIGPATDVYLLGALLHEIVTGEKRHAGQNILEKLAAAFVSAPVEYAPWVPSELAEICNKATAKEPNARHDSAAALREAVEAFLRHRSSRELADEASARAQELEALAAGEEVDPGTWARLSTEARFGFRQAMRDWPGNADAERGLQSLLELQIEYELEHENVRAAKAFLAELPHDVPALRQRAKALEGKLEERRRDAEDAEQMRHDADLGVAARARRRLSFMNAAVLGGGALVLFGLRTAGVYVAGYAAVIGLVTLLSITMAIGAHDFLRGERNRINARIITGILGTTLGALAMFVVCWLGDVGLIQAEALSMVIAAVGAAVLAATTDLRLGWCAAMFLPTAFLVLAVPDLRGLVIAVGGGGAFIVGALIWRRLGEDEA